VLGRRRRQARCQVPIAAADRRVLHLETLDEGLNVIWIHVRAENEMEVDARATRIAFAHHDVGHPAFDDGQQRFCLQLGEGFAIGLVALGAFEGS